jgi:RimJ/RimL family protein N-acetyltransferase
VTTDVRYDIGALVPPQDVPAPGPTTLTGRTVRLESVNPVAHTSLLLDELEGSGADPHMWDYMGNGPFHDEATFRPFLQSIRTSTDPRWFTVVSAATGQPIGLAAYLRIDPANRCLEVGHLCFGRSMQRSTAATETIFLLLDHVFGLGYRRVEWKCNDLNERSRRAALRFGFSYEGTFRKHMIIKGRNRDTAWYAIVDDDWTQIREAYVRWLDPANFDAAGLQLAPLDIGRS